MKNTYFCKCGRIVRKSTDADNTGNRDVKGCTGCPYLLPYGEQVYIKGEGFHLKVKGYECRVSKSLEYASLFSGCVADMGTCYVISLDYDFLEEVSNWIKENYPDGELSGSFSREGIRPTDFSFNGRYKYPICCAKNKKGMAAKAALQEHFFEDRRRKDMTREEEERKIKDLIENGKRAAQGAAPKPEQTSAAPEEKRDILAAENQIFIDPNGVKYRIGTTKQGKKTCWRTEHMENGEWLPNNVSFYEEFENAQGEFAAWIRTESLVPMEPENEDPAVTATLPAAPAAADPSDATEALAPVSEALPAFDYSGLDAEARDTLHVAETMIKSARQKFISEVADAVALAHDALCGTVVRNSDNGKYAKKDDTFFAWCASVGLSRSTAYQLLQVSTLFKGSTPVERQVLEQASPSLLYAAAKPSAPAEAVAAVKSGDITTYKEYQDLMQKIKLLETQNQSLLHSYETEKGKAEAAAQKEQDATVREEEARAAAHRYHVEKEEAEAQRNALIDREADWAKRVADSQAAQRNAEQERDVARDMLEKAKRRANHLVQERDDALEHLDAVSSEMDELRARPIEVAVAEPDPAEIERLATEKAEGIAAQRAEDLKMNDYDTVLFAISVIYNAWRSAGPAFRRLDSQCRAQLRRNLLERFAEIETEARDA